MGVEAMAPGAVRSPLVRRVVNALIHTRPAYKLLTSLMQPMGHAGQPEEVAEAAVWLCSDAASFVTGHNMVIDGGVTAA